MKNVEIEPLPLDRLQTVLTPERAAELYPAAHRARALLAGRTVWNVNATATGGGVAEMLQTLLGYWRDAGIDARWSVLEAPADFFTLTKRIHNVLHGEPGDGGPLGDPERADYEQVLADNLAAIQDEIRRDDIVLLHDPQTAGLVEPLKQRGAIVIWRSHIGRDSTNEHTDAGWAFLRPYVESADALVFSRKQYAPEWVPADRRWIIPPSIDPFSAKNTALEPAEVAEILITAGLVSDDGSRQAAESTPRTDGKDRRVRHQAVLADDSVLPAWSDRLLVQVSRWDRLKDMQGVMVGFAEHLPDPPEDVRLVLAGPEVSGVSDDPEGAEELAACRERWRALPEEIRKRVHIVELPMADVDENALMVNALQRHAYVVVQKSLMEGFGLTVTEAMWKGRPVIASAVGGINDQIRNGVDGLLLPDPQDLDQYAAGLSRLLDDPGLAGRMGRAAQEHARDNFLGDRHLRQYVELFEALLRS